MKLVNPDGRIRTGDPLNPIRVVGDGNRDQMWEFWGVSRCQPDFFQPEESDQARTNSNENSNV